MTDYEKDIAIMMLVSGFIVMMGVTLFNFNSHQTYLKCIENKQPNCMVILNPNLKSYDY
jgi:hypothetical protein